MSWKDITDWALICLCMESENLSIRLKRWFQSFSLLYLQGGDLSYEMVRCSGKKCKCIYKTLPENLKLCRELSLWHESNLTYRNLPVQCCWSTVVNWKDHGLWSSDLLDLNPASVCNIIETLDKSLNPSEPWFLRSNNHKRSQTHKASTWIHVIEKFLSLLLNDFEKLTLPFYLSHP